MKKTSNKIKNQPFYRFPHPANYGLFSVTEEKFRPVGDGKMVCLATDEIADEKTMRERGKGTWLKVSQKF